MPNPAPKQTPIIVWFRNDLRLSDNHALSEAAASGHPVIALFVFDSMSSGLRHLGAASKWWLHHSIVALADELQTSLGLSLLLRHGSAQDVLAELAEETGANSLYWNRRYDPAEIAIDKDIKERFTEQGLDVRSFSGHLLHEPSQVKTKADGPYRVYTPFWKSVSATMPPRAPAAKPDAAIGYIHPLASDNLDDWGLLPSNPDWATGFHAMWTPGENGAQARARAFLKQRVSTYNEARDLPAIDGTSGLSPHLRWGEISPYQIWRAIEHVTKGEDNDGSLTFKKEIVWREFAYHLLFHFPDLGTANHQKKFDEFPWNDATENGGAALTAWQTGQTGYPVVDAGMRQLWQTGWMHNRVRMIVGSFLVKHLLLDWRLGESWFWDTLVDADPASNTAGWQWIAGSGADAAPYFRVFNPITQGEKFDADGDFVRRFVPELAKLPNKYLNRPWEAPDNLLKDAGVELGNTYTRANRGPQICTGESSGRILYLERHDKDAKYFTSKSAMLTSITG